MDIQKELEKTFGDKKTQFKKERERNWKRGQRKDNYKEIKTKIKKIKQERYEQMKHEKSLAKIKHIAVLDMETDPFDAATRDRISPFAACLYSDQFEPIMLWEEDEKLFIEKLIKILANLTPSYIIYAHNGGRFDFMFLIHRLRGPVSFKGRGIMCAPIGIHELRDSYHLIPEKLGSYRKDEIDYSKVMRRGVRQKHKAQINEYLLSDCVYLFELVKDFLTRYGLKISIGQAALFLTKKVYPEYETVSASTDAYLRNFFFGGRVECLAGIVDLKRSLKLYDVNSMYPSVMVNYKHPIGREYIVRRGQIGEHTCFVDLNCTSKGAFPVRRENLGTIFPHETGTFRVSIHEYRTALKLNLIQDVRVNFCIDCELQTTFEKFVLPLYVNRQIAKAKLRELNVNGQGNSDLYYSTKRDDTFYKLLLNNSYGKHAQNCRRFKEFYLTDADGVPDNEPETWGKFPDTQCSDYAIWARPIKTVRFNNVGTAASITGAARAVLLEAIHKSKGAVYCDTDSLICETLEGVNIHQTELGAWDIETEINHIMIAGKKLYAYQNAEGKQTIRAKGVRGVSWENMKTLVDGKELVITAFAPTLTRTGNQVYINRTIRQTFLKG